MNKASVEKPWLKHFSEEARKAVIPKETIYTRIRKVNAGHDRDIALNYFDNRISYGKMFRNIDATAAALEQVGVKVGDVVSLCSATTPEMVYCVYACSKIGATALTLDPRRKFDELKTWLLDSKTDVLIILDLAAAQMLDQLKSLPLKTIVVTSIDNSMPLYARVVKHFKQPSPKVEYGGKVVPWKDFMKSGMGKESRTVGYGENEVTAITLTGGTTGLPKGVELTDIGFNAIAVSFENCGVPYTRGKGFMDIIPVFASYGIVASLHMPLSLGLELIIFPKFNAEKVGYYMKKYRPEHTLFVPAHYEKLIHSKEMKHFDLSFFRTAGSGGDTMNIGLETELNQFLADHGCKYKLSQGYGMSEVSSAASCYCNGNFKSQSVGYPLLTTTVAIFRPDTTEECDYNEEGEICITGPAVMRGYYHNPEETAQVMIRHPDGQIWVHSGDLGTMDEDGYIFIKGRIKRMVTRFDGHKIFPIQMENAFTEIDGIASCAVVGVQDSEHAQGMVAIAFIKLTDPSRREDVIKALSELYWKLEERGRPSDIILLDDLPLTAMGKVYYAKLSRNYEGGCFTEDQSILKDVIK